MRSLAARPLLALPLLLIPMLGSCNRTTDTFKPRITIQGGKGGVGVSQQKVFTVTGYVLDDTGVTSITVDDRPVPIEPGSRKLARFRFTADVKGGKGTYKIVARDAAGNKDVMNLPVTIDTAPPIINVTRFERTGNVVRVSGTAKDNDSVQEITVDGNRLNITPGPIVEFYAETTGVYADLQVRDNAGNITKKRAQ